MSLNVSFNRLDVVQVLSQKREQIMEQFSPPVDPQNPHHLNPWWLFSTDSPYCHLLAPPLAPLLQKQHTTIATRLPSRKLTNPPSLPKGWRDITGGWSTKLQRKTFSILFPKAGKVLQEQTPICLKTRRINRVSKYFPITRVVSDNLSPWHGLTPA